MTRRHRVTLTTEERDELGRVTSRGKADARKLTHARVLLQADASEGGPGWSDAAISEALRVSVRVIGRVRQRFVEDGLEAALLPKPSSRMYARKLDGSQEARLTALACSDPPAGKLHVEVTRERQGGLALDPVAERGDGEPVGPERQLMPGEQRVRGDRDVAAARLAAPSRLTRRQA